MVAVSQPEPAIASHPADVEVSSGPAAVVNAEPPSAVNPARAAAVAKLRAALLAAALEQVAETKMAASQHAVSNGTSVKNNLSRHVVGSASFKMAPRQHVVVSGGTRPGVKRSLSSGDSAHAAADQQQQQRPLIWDFFQDGRTVCTCR